MPTIPLNMLNNWHKFGLHRATYARVLPTALQGIMKREKRIREIAARAQILKNYVCTRPFWRPFLKIKKSISGLESPGYYPPIWVRNYPERVPHRWGHCISPYGLSPRRGWGGEFPCTPFIYIYIYMGRNHNYGTRGVPEKSENPVLKSSGGHGARRGLILNPVLVPGLF